MLLVRYFVESWSMFATPRRQEPIPPWEIPESLSNVVVERVEVIGNTSECSQRLADR
jgi:hypothetical protein